MLRWCDPQKKTKAWDKRSKVVGWEFYISYQLESIVTNNPKLVTFPSMKDSNFKKKYLLVRNLGKSPNDTPKKKLYIYKVPPPKKNTSDHSWSVEWKRQCDGMCIFSGWNFQHHQEAELFEATFEFFSANALVVVWIKNLEVSEAGDMNTTPKMNMVSWKIDIFNIDPQKVDFPLPS